MKILPGVYVYWGHDCGFGRPSLEGKVRIVGRFYGVSIWRFAFVYALNVTREHR